tara:strand:- start:172 stop:645 length:474 start_codon:yes stop_codon:yes gene_type:complete
MKIIRKLFFKKGLAKRFYYFGIGFSLGLIFLSFGPENRLKKTFYAYIDYFSPSKRVISHLYPYDKKTNKKKDPNFSIEAECQLIYYDLKKSDILSVREDGKVNFNLSDKKSTPCQYFVVENNLLNSFLSVRFEYCFASGDVTVMSFTLNNEKNICDN